MEWPASFASGRSQAKPEAEGELDHGAASAVGDKGRNGGSTPWAWIACATVMVGNIRGKALVRPGEPTARAMVVATFAQNGADRRKANCCFGFQRAGEGTGPTPLAGGHETNPGSLGTRFAPTASAPGTIPGKM